MTGRAESGQLARIVYVSWSVLPGTMANAVQVTRMVNALCATGQAHVTLIARRAAGDRRPEADIAREAGLADEARLILLPATRWRAGLRLMRIVRQLDADVVYSRVLPVFLGPLAAAKRIYEMHEPPTVGWWLKPKVFDWILRRGALTHLVFISGSLRRIVECEHAKLTLPKAPHKLVLHSGGNEPAGYVSEPEDTPFTLIYAGRSDKVDYRLLTALAQADPTLRFVIHVSAYGGVSPPSGLPNLVDAGWIDPAKLKAHLARAHVLIAPYPQMPSSAWFSPVKIFDYCAAGRPILISEHSPVREVVEDGVVGRILPAGDVDAWMKAIGDLRADPALRERMGRAGLRLSAEFGFASRAAAIMELLKIGADAPD